MKIYEVTTSIDHSLKETTSAGSVATVATPVGGLVSRQPKNADGTAKNGVDSNNLFGTKKKKTAPKKA
jgi:hypothetical protein